MSQTDQRNAFADALKALAVLGVFWVNGMGYWSAPEHVLPIGPPMPSDSALAVGVHALIFALFMGKAWPLLCFMFGHSLQLMAMRVRTQRPSPKAALRSRYKKLLLLGVAHGVLVYYGDVLSAYAICGLLIAGWSLIGLQALRKKLRFWLKLLLGYAVLMLTVAALIAATAEPFVPQPDSSFGRINSLWVWWNVNLGGYMLIAVSTLFILPKLVVLMLLGMVCARLRLLQPQRSLSHAVWRKPVWGWLFWGGLVAQLLVTWRVESALAHQLANSLYAWMEVNTWVGMAWVAGGVGMLARRVNSGQSKWVQQFSPAGRYTLVMYLGLSVSLAALAPAWLGGALQSMGWHPLANTVPAAALLLLLWVLALRLSHLAAQRRLRDPLANWLGKSTRLQNPEPTQNT